MSALKAKGQISAWQAGLIFVTMTANIGSTSVNRLIVATTGHDAWIAALVALPIAMLATIGILRLGEHAGKGLVSALFHTVGWLAWPILALYLVLFCPTFRTSGASRSKK